MSQTSEDQKKRGPGRPKADFVDVPADQGSVAKGVDSGVDAARADVALDLSTLKSGDRVEVVVSPGLRLFETDGIFRGGDKFTTSYLRAKQLGSQVKILGLAGGRVE